MLSTSFGYLRAAATFSFLALMAAFAFSLLLVWLPLVGWGLIILAAGWSYTVGVRQTTAAVRTLLRDTWEVAAAPPSLTERLIWWFMLFCFVAMSLGSIAEVVLRVRT